MKNSSLCIAMLFIWASHFLVDVMIGIWPVYKSILQLDLAKAGLIVALGGILGEGSQILFGTLSDKGYRKAMIVLGLILTTASAFMPYFSGYGFFFLLYLLTCIGSGAFHPSAAGLMNILSPKRRSLLMTIFASGGSVGLAFSQIIFTFVYLSMPGKSYLMLIPAVLLLFIFAFYKFPSIGPSASNVHTMCFGDFISFFKRLDLRFLYITLVSTQTLLWAIVFILPDVLITLDHVEWICYGGGHSCLILGGAAMMVPAGYLADKYSARNVILAATLIGAFIFYILLFFGNISSTFVLINLFVLGACLAVIQPVGIALGCKLEPNKPSMISAFLMGMVWVVSEALGPGGVGLMSKLFDDYAPVKALSVLGFFFLVGIYASWRLPKHVGSSDVAIEQVSV